jgi:hypothetical protein
MYNLRYHIASLVAVFLALSVGLLMGTIVVERGALDTQKTTLVKGLQQQYDSLRTTSQDLRAQADTLDAFSAEAVPELVKGALRDRVVVVIADPGAGEAVKAAVETVKSAGGAAAVMTFSEPGLGLGDASVVAAASMALGAPQASVDETSVVAALAREWTTAADQRALTGALVKAGVLRVEGLAADASVSGAIDCTAWDDKPDAAALRLTVALTGPGRFAVGAGTAKRPAGLAAAAVAAGQSGVEMVESPLGRVSLVWALTGRANGRYGPSKDADAQYPTPLFPAQ